MYSQRDCDHEVPACGLTARVAGSLIVNPKPKSRQTTRTTVRCTPHSWPGSGTTATVIPRRSAVRRIRSTNPTARVTCARDTATATIPSPWACNMHRSSGRPARSAARVACTTVVRTAVRFGDWVLPRARPRTDLASPSPGCSAPTPTTWVRSGSATVGWAVARARPRGRGSRSGTRPVTAASRPTSVSSTTQPPPAWRGVTTSPRLRSAYTVTARSESALLIDSPATRRSSTCTCCGLNLRDDTTPPPTDLHPPTAGHPTVC